MIPGILKNKFLGEKKYFGFVLVIIALILAIGFVTPLLLDHKKERWEQLLPEKTQIISRTIESEIKLINDDLLSFTSMVESEIQNSNSNPQTKNLVEICAAKNNTKYALGIYDSSLLMTSWNKSNLFADNLNFINKADESESFFFKASLQVYLLHWKKFNYGGKSYYLLTGFPVEEFFQTGEKKISLKESLEDLLSVEVEIDYVPFVSKTKDGRKHSVDILNNVSQKIGLITFTKTLLRTELNYFRDKVHIIQSILILIAFILFGKSLQLEYKSISNRFIKFFLFSLYLIALRWLMFGLEFPVKFLPIELTNPNFFSSAFGYGIVKSPAEFLITTVFFFIIALRGFAFTHSYFIETNDKTRTFLKSTLLLLPLLVFIILLTVRGFAAVAKSVIFDSTLKYFKDPEIFSGLPHLSLTLTILIFGTAALLIVTSFLLLGFKILLNQYQFKGRIIFYAAYSVSLVITLIFFFFQNEPLLGIALYLTTITSFFILMFIIIYNTATRINIILYSTIVASILSIWYMNYFNGELEKRSLKTTALTINRPNQSYLNFLLNETLLTAYQNNELISTFTSSQPNYNAASFIVWSNSSLRNENIKSSIALLDRNRKIIGKFNSGFDYNYETPQILQAFVSNELQVFDLTEAEEPAKKVLAGVIPLIDRNTIVGYVTATIEYDQSDFSISSKDLIYSGSISHINEIIDPAVLKIFIYQNNSLIASYGNFEPSEEISNQILHSSFVNDENWIEIEMKNENYISYAQKSQSEFGEKVIVVSLKEKELSLGLFNFFKLFIFHSVVILAFFIFITIRKIVIERTYIYSFRTQLLFSFLIISIIPVVALAAYNRINIADKSEQLINNALIEKAQLLFNHVSIQKKNNPARTDLIAFDKAAKEIKLSFRIFENNKSIYSTEEKLSAIGMLSPFIPSEAYLQFFFNDFNELFIRENINGAPHFSLYKKMKLNDKFYIIEINDVFNTTRTSFSTIEMDVFLFGIYSFAIVLILIMSTLFANRISYPIRKLTKATQAIAQGDYGIELSNTEKGEIKDLISGFNSMTSSLIKNQKELTQLERENAWKEMAKQVAHEINNPLTPMRLMIQQLVISYRDNAPSFDTVFDKITSTLLNQIDILNQIASEFSRFARMPNFELTKADLFQLLNECITLVNDDKVDVKLETDLHEALIDTDISQFKRMIINFLRNSVQAQATQIIVKVTKLESIYQISIIDNGSGIAQSILDNIFTSHFTTKKHGMGLGLKLAKRFIEGVNGKISLERTDVGGTTFLIEHPAVK